MATITRTVDVLAPADEVWKLVGGFGTIHEWHPLIDAPELEGANPPHGSGTRRIFGRGTPNELTEELLLQDGAGRKSSYAIPSPPWPVTNYTGYLRVIEIPAGSRVEWTVSYEPQDDAIEAILDDALGDKLFTAGLNAVADRFGRA